MCGINIFCKMSKIIVLDIFCGSGSFGEVAKKAGFEVISLDNRRRKGICEPTLKLDILKVPGTFFSSIPVSVAWFGLPCTIWSNASGGKHLDKNFEPLTELAKEHLKILDKVLDIISQGNIEFWFIENPRGKLKSYPLFLQFLEKSGAQIFTCTLSSYGFPTTKPTNIITNFVGLKLKDLDTFGRGAKNKELHSFNNLTLVKRQSTPKDLIKDILKQVKNK